MLCVISRIFFSLQVVIASNMGSDGRDTSIQIFDRFISLSFAENEEVLLDITYICFAAVSSILIASKVHEGQGLLTMANFPHFGRTDLIEFERMLLNKIGYQIAPLCTPSSFTRHLLGLCPEYSDLHVEIIQQVDKHIAEFSEHPDYSAFSPCTVAISALLISFACCRIQCGSWLAKIPNICLPRSDNPFNVDNLVNIDLCLTSLQRTESVAKLSEDTPQSPATEKAVNNKNDTNSKSCSVSPTGVDAVIGGRDEEIISEHTSDKRRVLTPIQLPCDMASADLAVNCTKDTVILLPSLEEVDCDSAGTADIDLDLEAMEEDATGENELAASLVKPKATSGMPCQYNFTYIY